MLGRWVCMMAMAGLLALSAAACDGDKKSETPAESKEWKVGVFLSLSGAETQFGTDSKEGIDLAVDEINAAGGVKGKPIKLVYEDDKSNPQEATNKVLQLIDRDEVVAILGEVASSRSKAGGIVANKKKVPMITPSSTHPDVTKVGPYVFRVCFTDELQGRMAAQFIYKTLKKEKVAILYASDDLYSSGLANVFREEAKRIGGNVVLEKSFLKTETNFTTYLNEIKDSGADIIFAPVYYNAMVPIARQAKATGLSGSMFVGTDGWDAGSLLADAGEELEGAYFTNQAAPDVPWPNTQKFVATYRERYKRDPSSLGALAYDAAKVLADAIGRSKDGTPESIRDAIAATKDFQGATGSITINEERNADKPVVIVLIKDKKFTYNQTVVDEKK